MTREEWNKLDNHEKAFKLYLIISYMNNEDAYYESGWLCTWPDGETYEQCIDDFEDEESYKDLEKEFISIYKDKEYHKDGLFAPRGVPNEVMRAAHYWDNELGLSPIVEVKLHM